MQNSESMGSGGTLAHDLLRPMALNVRGVKRKGRKEEERGGRSVENKELVERK